MCCSALQRLRIEDTRLDAASIERLAPLARLTQLELSREQWRVGSVNRLAGCQTGRLLDTLSFVCWRSGVPQYRALARPSLQSAASPACQLGPTCMA